MKFKKHNDTEAHEKYLQESHLNEKPYLVDNFKIFGKC